MKSLLFSLFILILSVMTQTASAVTACNHGTPQPLGIEKKIQMGPLPEQSSLQKIDLLNFTNPTHKLQQSIGNTFLKQNRTTNKIISSKNFLISTNDGTQVLNSPTTSHSKLRMKILILSATNDEAIEPTIVLAKTILNNYGIPFDHVSLTTKGAKTSSLPQLQKSKTEGLYYGIILSTGLLAYADDKGNFQSSLSTEEWKALHNYQDQFNVKSISLYSFPGPYIEMSFTPVPSAGSPVKLYPTESYLNLDPAYPQNMEMELSGSWSYSAATTSPNVEPILYYDESLNPGKAKGIAAAKIKVASHEEMHFFFAQSKYFTSSYALSSGWVKWLTNNAYIGKRRTTMAVHIDDLFLSTGLFSKYEDKNVDGYFSEKFVYRIDDQDLNYFASEQKNELRPLLNNPEFRIEMAFNGKGIWEHGGYYSDLLLKSAMKNIDQFYWVTHTFSHGDLNWMDYKQTSWELKTNMLIAKDFIKPELKQYYTDNGIVTPRISGLFNPRALKAMLDSGIHFAVGDNTRKELLPENLHHGLYTTKEFNGHDGLFIIPRNATEIYYNVGAPNELADEYNVFYTKHFGKESTPEEIFEREATRVVRNFLNYDYSPYMFHQGNLRAFDWYGKRESLVSLWIKYATKELRKYSSLPVLSLKMEDLYQHFMKRRSMDACNIEVWQNIENTQVRSITLSNQKNCPVWITGLNGRLEGWKSETYGPDVTQELEINSPQERTYKLY